jgi:hypothetical protein
LKQLLASGAKIEKTASIFTDFDEILKISQFSSRILDSLKKAGVPVFNRGKPDV